MALIGIGRDRRAAILAGGFVAAAIVIVVGWVVVRGDIFAQGNVYFGELDDVTGLEIGADVVSRGYRVGTVRTIEPIFDGGSPEFRVLFSVDPAWRVPEDSTIALASPNLLAGLVVDLRLGTSDRDHVLGTAIPIDPEVSLPERLTDIVADVESILGVVDDTVGAANRVLSGNEATISETIEGTRDMVAGLGTIVDDASPIPEAIETLVADIGGQVDALTQSLTGITDDLRALTAADAEDGLSDLMETANAAAVEAQQLMTRTDQLMAQLGPGLVTVTSDAEYSLQQVADSLNVLLANLERASQELADLLTDIRANPSVLLTGRDSD